MLSCHRGGDTDLALDKCSQRRNRLKVFEHHVVVGERHIKFTFYKSDDVQHAHRVDNAAVEQGSSICNRLLPCQRESRQDKFPDAVDEILLSTHCSFPFFSNLIISEMRASGVWGL